MRVSGSECWIRGSGLRISMLHGMFHKLQGFPGFHRRLMGGVLGLRVSKGAYEIPPRPFIRSYKYDLSIAEARNLEHGFRRISARIPYTLP